MTTKRYKFEEIALELEENIISQFYKTGDKLPSVRVLKGQYNTSITTIQRAYEHLLIKDLVQSEPKSGYYVKYQPASNPVASQNKKMPLVVRDAFFTNNLSQITSLRSTKSELSEFNVAQPGDFFIPQKLILRTMQQVVREKGASLLRYYPVNGSKALKEQIAQRTATYKTVLNPEELIITDGALQALYIALASICSPGDIVAVESPCVFSVLEILRVQQLRVVEVPVDIRQGFDVDLLKKASQKMNIKAVIVTPNFHNPTGSLLSDGQKQYLHALAIEQGIPLIENDIYGDLHFSGHRPINIKSLDGSGLVLTCSSYSKSLAPGIRLGWLSAGKFFKKAEQIKYALGSTVSPIYQETITKLISSTSYDRHVRLFRNQLASQCYHTQNLIRRFFPESTLMSTPAGGSNLWVQMDRKLDMQSFYKLCEETGIRFTPGYTFSFSKAYDQFFRLVFSDKYSAARENALKIAGDTAAKLIGI